MIRLAPALLLLIACEPPELTAACDAAVDADLSGSLIEGPVDDVVDSELVVQGSASHARGLAIRQITVAGVPATSDSFNFERFSVAVPWSVLASMAEDDVAAVDVIAEDACGVTATLSTFDVSVSPVERGDVTELNLDVDLGSTLDWLPADGVTQAALRLTANPEARGVPVDLSATVGTVHGAASLRLTEDGDVTSASALYVSDTPGTVLLTATAGGQLASHTLVVAAPPAVLPAFADVSPGGRASLSASSAGAVQACRATADPGLTVTSGAIDLTRADGAFDENGDGHPDIRVEAAEDAELGATAVVTCRDPFGQSGTAQVEVR